MAATLDWNTAQLFVGAVLAVGLGVGGFVGTIVWWLASQVREVDRALALLDKALSQAIVTSRHDVTNKMQTEVGKTDIELEARRKEIQDLAHRVTRIEARMNGKHPKN